MRSMNASTPNRPRGFLLLVVVGIMAVLLVVCGGFLSYTRGEAHSVQTLRDKADCADIAQSAVDWMVANIGTDLFSGGNTVDPAKHVSYARTGSQWWYRPYERGLKDCFPAWTPLAAPYGWASRPPCVDAAGADQAEWTYLPDNHFPEGGVRGRFMAVCIDANAFVNLNDWLEDCNPTQCQAAHMFMDGYGEQELERYRSLRDGGVWNRTMPLPNFAPLRYHEAWRVVTRSTRYLHWPYGYDVNSERLGRMCSPNWVTTNTPWLGLFGAELSNLKTTIVSDGIWIYHCRPSVQTTVANYYPPTPNEGFEQSRFNSAVGGGGVWAQAGYKTGANNYTIGRMPMGLPFTIRAHVDPDTGRSPVNVNTCYNSGERLPTNIFNGTPCYTMEAVFNVESLRRIVQVGSMYYMDSAATNQSVAAPAALSIPLIGTPADRVLAWEKHEQLRTKMAYQYQETLCRYFTGTYNHPATRKFPPIGAAADPIAVGAASTNYSSSRFPMGVVAFRRKVGDDLDTISAGTAQFVDFDDLDVPDVLPGRLDRRAAAACYDNVVPGTPSDLARFGAGTDPSKGPLRDLYDMQLGRDEIRPRNNEVDPASTPAVRQYNSNVFGYHNDTLPVTQTVPKTYVSHSDSGYNSYDPAADGVDDGSVGQGLKRTNILTSGTAGVISRDRWLHLRPKGLDIARTTGILSGTPVPEGPYHRLPDADGVPYRQLAFGPDWFSTELTTASTCFIFIVTAQIVDGKSVTLNPADPSKHVDVFSGQWGFCVELAPDIRVDDDTMGGTEAPFQHWYRQARPTEYKPAPSPDLKSMDKNCSTTKSTHGNGKTYFRTSVARKWSDFRGLTDAQAATYYTSPTQIQKRVVIKGIWSLNTPTGR